MKQFRGKVKSDNPVISKRWAYGDKVKIGARVFIVLPDAEVDSHSHGEEYIIGIIEVFPASVGQGIGRKDSNGVEIYEGSIMKFTSISPLNQRKPATDIGVVEYNDREACFDMDRTLSVGNIGGHNVSFLVNFTKAEVIGTITDDPGLLKEQDHA